MSARPRSGLYLGCRSSKGEAHSSAGKFVREKSPLPTRRKGETWGFPDFFQHLFQPFYSTNSQQIPTFRAWRLLRMDSRCCFHICKDKIVYKLWRCFEIWIKTRCFSADCNFLPYPIGHELQLALSTLSRRKKPTGLPAGGQINNWKMWTPILAELCSSKTLVTPARIKKTSRVLRSLEPT